jgi:hypothetical protein
MPDRARIPLRRAFVVLTGLWLGMVATLALVAAPSAFAMLDRSLAGRVAGEMFRIEAHAGLALALVLLLIERRLSRRPDGGAVLSANLMLVLAALFCTVSGYFALQPMMEDARNGVGRFSFGVLHGVSSALFALKGLLLLALAWRSAVTSAPPPAA